MAQPALSPSRPSQAKGQILRPRASPLGTSPRSSDAESLADTAVKSENPLASPSARQDKQIPENPFDSESSRSLFDAIDRLQSLGISQKLSIPKLIIVGGQSTGKSSLLQSLTDIPFPVGDGLCTRFATRIVSRRTAPGSKNVVNITIGEPEVADIFNYPPDDSYKDYRCTKDHLGIDDFQAIMQEISTDYMGIREGQGINKKNFATQVLRIELSGPSRSHFNILDVPGVFSYTVNVNDHEMVGIRRMVEEYMKQPANTVICVADASSDLANQEIFTMAANLVDKTRLVGVFTKCDLLTNPAKVIKIASGEGGHTGAMHGGWFVVRSRTEDDGEDFDLKEAERKLFGQPAWGRIREERKGSTELRKYLSKLLCDQIRGNFPDIQQTIRRLLSDAHNSRRSLGDARPTHSLRQQYVRDVVERYHVTAIRTLKCPGSFPDELLRVRGLVHDANQSFAADMISRGHSFQFEDPDVDPMEKLNGVIAAAVSPQNPPVTQGQAGRKQDFIETPPSTPQKKGRPAVRVPEVHDEPAPFVEEVRQQLRVWQTTELPGLVNTEVIKVLFKKQSEKWESIAEEHIEAVACDIEIASKRILRDVCSPESGSGILHDELSAVSARLHRQTKEQAISELREHCRRERESHLQTTDKRFNNMLQAWRSIRLLSTLNSMPSPPAAGELNDPMVHMEKLFRHFHHSMEDNMVHDVHDVVKVYYQLALDAFIRYVTRDIVEAFISHKQGPLEGLSTDWVLERTEEEIAKLAREDEETIHKRAHFDGIIEKLRAADEIAERARK